MTDSVVIMGVAGCGKSSLGAALAQSLGLSCWKATTGTAPPAARRCARALR
jgi:gluconate kinase